MPATSTWRLTQRAEENLVVTHKETLWIRAVSWIVLAIAVSYTLAFLRRDDLSNDVVWILHIKGYMLMAFMHAVLYFVYRRVCDHIYLGPGLRKISTKIPDEDAVPIKLEIRQNKVLTGIDEGYLWLEDGTLYYKGLQTNFRLNHGDVPPLSHWRYRDRPNPGQGKLPDRLPLRLMDRDMEVRFAILDAYEDFASRRKAHTFRQTVYDWLTDDSQGNLESLLPPTSVHPGLQRSKIFGMEPVVASWTLVSIDLLLVISMNYGVNYHGAAAFFAATATAMHIIFGLVATSLAIHCTRSKLVRDAITREIEAFKASDPV